MMLTVAAGIVIFTLTILSLIALLMLAHRSLGPSGDARIVLNGDSERALRVATGGTLLSTLGDMGVLLPSACGGKGTCGACKVAVTKGGGSLLPTEAALVRRAEAERGVRLACQVRVRGDLEVTVPSEVLSVKTLECRVVSNLNVATFIKELVLQVEGSEGLTYQAGAYMQLIVPPHTVRYSDFDVSERFVGDWQRLGLLALTSTVAADEQVQRAYSLASYPGEQGRLMFNIRIATPPPGSRAQPGKASSYAFGLTEGDRVQLSGPFGDFRVNDSEAEMVFVGGGAGMAPLRSMVFDQLMRVKTRRTLSYWYGARSLKESFYVEGFRKLAARHDNFDFHLVLSSPAPADDWHGDVGNVHALLLERYLKQHVAPEDVEYYLCGPPPMTDACLAMLKQLGVPSRNVRYDAF